jgi:riboflavin kinase/FMN adenylyltransferase
MSQSYRLQDLSIEDAWLTIGSFDGVHLGHQQIIRQITSEAHAAGAPAVVLTFYPHPSVVLRGKKDAFYLTLPEEKAAILNAMGVDYVVIHPFDRQVAYIEPHNFIEKLHHHLGFSQLWVGYDFALGRNRAGDVPRLEQLGEQFGFSLQVVDAIKHGEKAVSSSRIRSALERGEISKVADLLGRRYSVSGRVIHGDGRGKQIGIPTANLEIDRERAVPGAGVYACLVTWKGTVFSAVTNIGVRPTFETEPVSPRVETHILDFSHDLYGEQIDLEFVAHLRSEQRFTSIDALVSQIQSDITAAREMLAAVCEY